MTKTKNNIGLTLSLFLGSTRQEQIKSLNAIKNSMVDCMINALHDELIYTESTKELLQSIYSAANMQLEKLLDSKYVN